MKSADLIIALGTRLGDINTMTYSLLRPPRIGRAPRARAPRPDRVESCLPGRSGHRRLAVGAAIGLAELDANRVAALERVDRSRRGASTRSSSRCPQAGPRRGVDLAVVIRHLATHLPANAIIANGAGNFTVWVHRFFTYRQPHTELAPTSGAMGYGFPASIAASLRYPERVTVCVAGDGDFLMYPQELATAAQYGARVIVLVVNNGMYGTIRMHQDRRFPGRVSGTDAGGAGLRGAGAGPLARTPSASRRPRPLRRPSSARAPRAARRCWNW